MAQQTEAQVPPIETRGYAHPEVLVSTQWVEDHLDDPNTCPGCGAPSRG